MSYTICNEVFVDGPDNDLFEQNFGASMSGTLINVPGLVAARLLRPSEADRGYLSILEFTDRAAYLRYLDSESFAAAHKWPDHAPIDHNRLTTYETILTV